MTQQLLLAIDQGTSGSKAVVFDTRGNAVARCTVPTQSLYPHPGFVEQDPQEIYATVVAAVKGAVQELSSAALDPAAIACCGISNQRETFLVWDRSGNALCNAVVWQCKRSVDICTRYKETPLETMIRERTGLIVDPYFSGTKVVWLNENNSLVKEAIAKKTACFGTVDTWLLYRLTNCKRYLTDYTNACRTLFFNIDTLSWDYELLKEFGLSGLQLAEPRASAHDFGTTNFDGAVPVAVPITAMIGDSHASAFGQSCFTPGSAKVTLGTGSSILMNTGSARQRSSSGMVETICFSTKEKVDYALEGIIVSCGATLTWLRDTLGLFDNPSELAAAAQRAATNGGVYLLPAFAGLGGPHWKMHARGALTGLTFASSRDQILRASLESIAYQVKDVVAAMENDSGIALAQLAADGGISKDPFVMQFLADLLDTAVVQRGIEEVSALGAACMAGLGAGVFDSTAELEGMVCNPQRYSSGAGRGAALQDYSGWQEALKIL